MASNSSIEWCHHTFNPWIGCTKVSDGCKNCYAETLMDTRYKKTKWGPRGLRVIKAESGWKEPLKWNHAAEAVGERHRVFCASLADVFEGPETMPAEARETVDDARHRLFDLIYQTPHLDWLLLTKLHREGYGDDKRMAGRERSDPRIRKHAAGRLLDGVEHNAIPVTAGVSDA